jgi:hypothetical protein
MRFADLAIAALHAPRPAPPTRRESQRECRLMAIVINSLIRRQPIRT